MKAALGVSDRINEARARRGLRPRPVRAVVVGFPNVGKSALINRCAATRARPAHLSRPTARAHTAPRPRAPTCRAAGPGAAPSGALGARHGQGRTQTRARARRLLGRRLCESAAKPGVTRVLKWLRIGGQLDLLDSPGARAL